jgi:hypothetical protein
VSRAAKWPERETDHVPVYSVPVSYVYIALFAPYLEMFVFHAVVWNRNNDVMLREGLIFRVILRTILQCHILLWTILPCTVSYCEQFCLILCFTVNNTALYYVLLWTILPYTILYCNSTALYCVLLWTTVLCFTIINSALYCVLLWTILPYRGRAVALCLRHCATNRQVAGSIPDGVIGLFRWQPFRSHYGPEFDSASNRNE